MFDRMFKSSPSGMFIRLKSDISQFTSGTVPFSMITLSVYYFSRESFLRIFSRFVRRSILMRLKRDARRISLKISIRNFKSEFFFLNLSPPSSLEGKLLAFSKVSSVIFFISKNFKKKWYLLNFFLNNARWDPLFTGSWMGRREKVKLN